MQTKNYSRREFVRSAATGLAGVVLAGCVSPKPIEPIKVIKKQDLAPINLEKIKETKTTKTLRAYQEFEAEIDGTKYVSKPFPEGKTLQVGAKTLDRRVIGNSFLIPQDSVDVHRLQENPVEVKEKNSFFLVNIHKVGNEIVINTDFPRVKGEVDYSNKPFDHQIKSPKGPSQIREYPAVSKEFEPVVIGNDTYIQVPFENIVISQVSELDEVWVYNGKVNAEIEEAKIGSQDTRAPSPGISKTRRYLYGERFGLVAGVKLVDDPAYKKSQEPTKRPANSFQ